MRRFNGSKKKSKLVGELVRKKREALKMTQKALGLLFQPPVTTQFISNIERGATPLPLIHVPLLIKTLGIREEEITDLLEKDYIFKVKRKLGIDLKNKDQMKTETKTEGKIDAQTDPVTGPVSIPVTEADLGFMQKLYAAYRLADLNTRQTFAKVSENILHLSKIL